MNVSPRTAKSVVIGAVAGTAILSALVSVVDGTAPSIRVGIGATVVGAALYAATDVAPPLAASVAALMFIGTLYRHGPSLAETLTGAVS